MRANARALVVVAALATGVACDGPSGPTGCITSPEATLLAVSPPSGTALAPGQSVEISAQLRFAACREAGVLGRDVLARLDYPVR